MSFFYFWQIILTLSHSNIKSLAVDQYSSSESVNEMVKPTLFTQNY